MSGNDANTVALLHFNAADGQRSYIDTNAGGSGHFWSDDNGAHHPAISASQFEFAPSSCRFFGAAGVGGSVSTPNHADFQFGTGDFTVDFWVYFLTGSLFHTSYNHGYASAGALVLQTTNDAAPKQQVVISHVVTLSDTVGQSLNSWIHYAVARSGTTIALYNNGVQVATATDSTNITGASAVVKFGCDNGVTNGLDGYADELRISKGIARWTSGFTPPSSPYSPDLNRFGLPRSKRLQYLRR